MIDEYLSVLDDAAFGAATPVEVHLTGRSGVEVARRQQGIGVLRLRHQLPVDLDYAGIVDVQPSTAVRQADVTTARTMIERVSERHDLSPRRLASCGRNGFCEELEDI